MWAVRAACFLALFAVTAAAQWPQFPAPTVQFFDTGTTDAVPAAGGGVWAATPEGIVRYTAAGKGTVLPVPGGRPGMLAAAPDGTIWFTTTARIGRISASGVVLEQYDVAGVRTIETATDGALWYVRGSLGEIVGRIAGGVPTELGTDMRAWSLASAPGGAMWVLGNGFGTENDPLYRVAPDGAVTVLPLGHDVLFGELWSLPDGTLFIGTGIRQGLLRLRPGSQTPEGIAGFDGYYYGVDSAGNVWSNRYEQLTFIGSGGMPRFTVELPRDPRDCSNVPLYSYRPLVIEPDGGLWLRIINDAVYIPLPLPCTEPDPPPMPDLVRLDTAALVHANAAHDVPALSPGLVAALMACLALAAALKLRG